MQTCMVSIQPLCAITCINISAYDKNLRQILTQFEFLVGQGIFLPESASNTNSKHWFMTFFLQPLPYLVTPQGPENCQLMSSFFVGVQTVVSLLQTTQIKQGVSFIATNKVYTSTNKTTIVWIKTELLWPDVYPSTISCCCICSGGQSEDGRVPAVSEAGGGADESHGEVHGRLHRWSDAPGGRCGWSRQLRTGQGI